ncbi:MAG: hypothetical protein IPM61_11915 [Chlorobi bacterium]|nr:hypothetical protein [Chlorobiota bacterium]
MFSRSLSFPILALLVFLLAAAACVQVWQVGNEWFVQRPPLEIVIRNLAMVMALLVGGWLLLPRASRTSKAATLLALAASLFSIGLAVQFRLGHDYPRQLSRGEVTAIADSLQRKLRGATQDSVRSVTRRVVAQRNAELRRSFNDSRIDLRLARSLERAYGPTPLTQQVLGGRAVGPADSLLLRLLPVLAGLLAILLAARSTLPILLSSRWKVVGFYGSLAVCIATLIYLTTSGGIRGATVAPQELLKLTIPVAWAGFLLHFRNALRPGASGGVHEVSAGVVGLHPRVAHAAVGGVLGGAGLWPILGDWIGAGSAAGVVHPKRVVPGAVCRRVPCHRHHVAGGAGVFGVVVADVVGGGAGWGAGHWRGGTLPPPR